MTVNSYNDPVSSYVIPSSMASTPSTTGPVSSPVSSGIPVLANVVVIPSQVQGMSEDMGAAILYQLQLLTISNSGPGPAMCGSAMAHVPNGPISLMYECAAAQVLSHPQVQ